MKRYLLQLSHVSSPQMVCKFLTDWDKGRNPMGFCKPLSFWNSTFCRFSRLLLLAGLLLVSYACDDLDSVSNEPDVKVPGTGALYMLCDGNYSLNNSTLSLYNFEKSALTYDYFQTVNGRKLGDTGNDLQRYGSKLYAVVNGSSQVEVMDARTGKSLKQLAFFDGSKARQPRYIAFWKNKAYVCSFDGTVARIDTASLVVEDFLMVGRNPDGITASAGKLYVSNSGGLDYATDLGYDKTVSVVDAVGFTELKKLAVGPNPGKILADNFGYVWVSVRGDYHDVQPAWVCIDTQTDQVFKTFNRTVSNVSFSGEKAYIYSYNETSKQSSIGVFNLRTQTIEKEQFIQDGTQIKTPYGITADAESGTVFITDALDYVASGDVYCFSEAGRLVYTIRNVGVNPNTVLPVNDFKQTGGSGIDTAALEAVRIDKVWEFTPAPGQYVGLYPAYKSGDNAETMRIRAEQQIKGLAGGLVSLGRYGGHLTFSFKNPVQNLAGKDFKVFGNAFTNASEPGIVEVSEDVNQNGLPDDPWYELAGSDYTKPTTTHGYSITYYKPDLPKDTVRYVDNRGKTGYVNAYYPAWVGDSIVCGKTLMPNTVTQNASGFWIFNALPWGYADNAANSTDLTGFDLDRAVDDNGASVPLTKIHFVRVYTGVNQNAGVMGELSTEVTGAENLHP